MNCQNFTCLTLLILVTQLFAACGISNSGDEPPTNTEVEFTGVYIQGFEDSDFISCDYDESRWKPVFNDQSFDQLQEFWEIRDPDGGPYTRLRIVGILSKKGNYSGIYTTYDREIQIVDILDIEYTDNTEC